MAVNKRKVLEAARKYAQKGAKEKALKEYNTLLKLDPKDGRLRLEIGDAHRRWGQIEQAADQYNKVAEQYSRDGFDARAVAVYKQILNLDPKRYSAHVALSELYQRMGLDAEAATALQSAADGYHKEGKKREALDLLRKLATLDPTNTTSRMKVADLLRQEGMEDDAVAEYDAVAEQLARQDSPEALVSVYARILEISPRRVETLAGAARVLIGLRKPDKAEPLAKRAAEVAPDVVEHFELLSEIYTALDRGEDLEQATRSLAKLYRERGDEDRAREMLQRLPSDQSIEELADGDSGEDLSGGTDNIEDFNADQISEELSDDELLDDDYLGTEDGGDSGADELMLDEPLEASRDGGGSPQANDAPPEGEPDQLLAEASVYLRYGKRDQAIANLRAVLAQEPENRSALRTLAETCAEDGDEASAIELWIRAARAAREEEDEADFASIHERIAAIDPDAAAELEPVEAEPEPQVDESEDVGIELDDATEDDDGGVEIDLDDSTDSEDPDVEIDLSADESTEVEVDLSADESTDVEIDLGGDESTEVEVDLGGEIEIDVDGDDSEEEEAPADSEAADPVSERLEQAEFFVQQNMFDEAEAIYQAILKETPNHADALMKLCEVTAAKRAAEEDADDATLGEIGAEEPGIEVSVEAPEPAPAPKPAAKKPAAKKAAAKKAPAKKKAAEQTPAPKAPVVQVSAIAVDDPEDSFDLAAELRGMFEDEDGQSDANEASGVLSTVEDGFESIFSDFKRGVSQTLSEGDHETRYDLGIAYKEMGLIEDAIAEFRICLQSPARLVDSLNMMGLCALDLGRPSDAMSHFEQALATEGLPEVQRIGLTFELGRSFEAADDRARARSAYQTVAEADPSFPGIQQRIAALDASGSGGAAAASDGDYENFEDLTAEVAESGYPEESDTETFETFDDVIAAANESGAEAASEGDAGSATDSASGGTKKSGRKKKISFV